MKTIRHITPIAAACLAASLWSLPAAAQDENKETMEIPGGMPTQEAKELISVSLEDTPLNDVVRLFTRLANINIISSSELEGNVTVNLNDVEWEPALRQILDSKGYVLQETEGGVFKIISREDLAGEPLEVKNIFLKYTTTEMVLPVVQNMLVHTNASASSFPSSNAIVVKETPTQQAIIADFVTEIDQPRPQVYIETKFVELNDQAIENLGINWQMLEALEFTGGVGNEYTRTRRKVGVDSAVGQTTDIRSRNKERNSGSFEQDFTDGLTEGSIPGITGGIGSGAVSAANRTQKQTKNFTRDDRSIRGKNFTAIDEDGIEFNPVLDRTDILTAILNPVEFRATLSALKENAGTKIVSNPKVMVISGNTATNKVIRKVPIVSSTVRSSGDTLLTETKLEQYEEIGIKLGVTPTVNTDDNVTLDIIAELSNRVDFDDLYPTVDSREIYSSFNIKTGGTIAMGGLIRTQDNERVTKIPLLGDIPVIGKYLFSHSRKVEEQDEIIVFVTVQVIDPENNKRETGLPENSRLIHRHMASGDIEKAEWVGEFNTMREETDQEVSRILAELGISTEETPEESPAPVEEAEEVEAAPDDAPAAEAEEAAVVTPPMPPAPPQPVAEVDVEAPVTEVATAPVNTAASTNDINALLEELETP